MANSQVDANHRCRDLIDNIFESLSTIVQSIPDSKDEIALIVKPLCALVEKAYHKVFQAYAATYLMIKDKDEVKRLEGSLQAAYDSLETYAELMKQYMLTPFRVLISRLHNNRKSFEIHFMACASRILPSKEYETLALFNASLHEEQQTFAVKITKSQLRSSVTSSSSNGSTPSAKSIDDMGYIDFERTLSPEIMPIAPILQEGLSLTPAEKHVNTAVKAFLLSQHRSRVKGIALEEKGSQVEKIVELDEPVTPVLTGKGKQVARASSFSSLPAYSTVERMDEAERSSSSTIEAPLKGPTPLRSMTLPSESKPETDPTLGPTENKNSASSHSGIRRLLEQYHHRKTMRPRAEMNNAEKQSTSKPETESREVEIPMEISEDGKKLTILRSDLPGLLQRINSRSSSDSSQSPPIRVKPIPMASTTSNSSTPRGRNKLRKTQSTASLLTGKRSSSDATQTITEKRSTSSNSRPSENRQPPSNGFQVPPHAETYAHYGDDNQIQRLQTPSNHTLVPYHSPASNHVPLQPPTAPYYPVQPYYGPAPPPQHTYRPASSWSDVIWSGVTAFVDAAIDYREQKKWCACRIRHYGRAGLHHPGCGHCQWMGCMY